MKARIVLTLIVSMSALVLFGCGRKQFGATCENAAQLPGDWAALNLPVGGDDTRICEVSGDSIRIHSYQWGNDKAQAAEAFRQALTSAGYVPDTCNPMSCSYWKDNVSVNVHPMDFRVRNKELIRLVVRRRADPTPPRS